jgi:putative ubiquitin-RnfH superfamily antitoxin RatB of RatAB toxin-antitoxin module
MAFVSMSGLDLSFMHGSARQMPRVTPEARRRVRADAKLATTIRKGKLTSSSGGMVIDFAKAAITIHSSRKASKMALAAAKRIEAYAKAKKAARRKKTTRHPH